MAQAHEERKKGLKRTIEIIEKHLGKIQTDQKANVKEALDKLIEITLTLKMELKKKEPIDIKILKKEIDTLLVRVNEQKNLFQTLLGKQQIDAKAESQLNDALKKINEIEKAAEENDPNIKEKLEKNLILALNLIQSLLKVEERMGKDKVFTLRRFIKKEQEIEKIVEEADRIMKALLEIKEGKASESDPVFQKIRQIEVMINQELGQILPRELKAEEYTIWELAELIKRREQLNERIDSLLPRLIHEAKGLTKDTPKLHEEIDRIRKEIENVEQDIKRTEEQIILVIQKVTGQIQNIVAILTALEKALSDLTKLLSPEKKKPWQIWKK